MLTRRVLLGTAVSSLTFPFTGNAEYLAGFVVLVVRGVSPDVPQSAIYQFILPFLEARVPLMITIDPENWENCDSASCSELWNFLKQAAREYPGYIEIIPEIKVADSNSPYFQARSISETARIFRSFRPETESVNSDTCFTTAFLTDSLPSENLTGFRSGGLRNLIVLNGAGAEGFASSVHVIRGLAATDDGSPIQSGVEVSVPDANAEAIVFQIAYTEGSASVDLQAQAERIIDSYRLVYSAQNLRPALATDIHLHVNRDYSQRVVFHAGGNIPVAAILNEMNIPYLGKDPVPDVLDPAGGAGDLRNIIETYRNWDVRRVLNPVEGQFQHCGINDEGNPGPPGRFTVTSDHLPDLPQVIGEKSDHVIDLSGLNLTPESSRRLRRALAEINTVPTRYIVPPDQIPRVFLPHDPVYAAFRDAHLFGQFSRQGQQGSGHSDPDLLLKDAPRAWQYFSRWDDPRTGLCPTTVFQAGDRRYLHQKATLWDIGSLLFALMAGLNMGFVTREAFLTRVLKILAAIPTVTIHQLHLPASLISTQSGQALTQEFNSCDCARLLSAFVHLRRWTELEPVIAGMLEYWDLAEIIRDDQPHNVDARGFHSTYHSHCTHYSRLAFAEFGFTHDSPYRTQHPELSAADQKMHLLNRCAYIGLLGAEPLLFEPLEFEATPESTYLADILLTQHWLHHQKSGQLSAVSEAPVNRPPWFIYEGLDLLNDETRWNIALVHQSRDMPENETRLDFSMVNTKAAYLWAATHPGEYTHKLVEHIRGNLPEDMTGFPPGIYHRTGAAEPEFTDINTNAVVLQALSYMIPG